MPGIWVNPTKYIDFEEKPKVAALSKEIASREAAYDWTGMMGLLPDPDPVLRNTGDGVEVLESLTADGHLISVIQTRKLGTLKKEYRWEAGYMKGEEPTAVAKKLRDDLVSDLERVDLYSLISNLLDAPLYGFTPIEIMWKRAAGRLAIEDLRSLPNRWFGYDDKNNPKFLSINNPWEGEALPFGKFVLARHFPTYDNPYGLRLLSRCFWPIVFKRGGVKFWVTFAEKYGMPYLLGKYPRGASGDEQKEMLAKLASMVQNAVGVIPEGGSVELLERKGASAGTVYERLRAAMDSEMSKVIMGQTLTAESKPGSGYAQSKTHENVLKEYQEADQKLVKTAMEELSWIYGLVNAPGIPAPEFTWFEEQNPKNEVADRDKTIMDGDPRFKPTKAYYVRTYGFNEDDFELVEAEAGQANKGESPQFSEDDTKFSPEQQGIEELIEKIIPEGAKGLEENEAAILKVIQEAESYEEAMEGLLELYPKLDVNDISDLLNRSLLSAEIYGRHTVAT